MEYIQTRPKSPPAPGVPTEIHHDVTPVQAPVIIHVPETSSGGKDWSVWGVMILLCLLLSAGVSAYVSKWATSDQAREIEALKERVEKRESDLQGLQRQVTRLETQMERVDR